LPAPGSSVTKPLLLGAASGVGAILRRLGVVAMSVEQLARTGLPAQDDGEQMVAFLHVSLPKVQSAAGTFASLLLQESSDFSRQQGVAAQAVRPVEPIAVVDTLGADDFGVPADGLVSVFDQTCSPLRPE